MTIFLFWQVTTLPNPPVSDYTCDVHLERALETVALQMASGVSARVRGRLDLIEERTKRYLGVPAHTDYIHREIETAKKHAVREGKLQLARRRMEIGRSGPATQWPRTASLETPEEERIAQASEGSAPRGARMGRPGFTTDHKREFSELLAGGIELHAINCHPDKLPFGPWTIVCDRGDAATKARLKSQFRAAARKAAIAAGAPRRAHVLNWWVGELAGSQNLPFMQGLIQRSIDYCVELETNAAELAPIVGGENMTLGLSRDRYPCDRPVAYWLYDEQHQALPNAPEELEFWQQHIWKGFDESIAELVRHPRKPRRWMDKNGISQCEPKEETRRRLRAQIENRTVLLDAWILGLSYDLAVLQANHTVDLGLPIEAAMQSFGEAARVLERDVRLAWQRSARLWGLSWLKQERRGVDLTQPHRVVAADLRHLLTSPTAIRAFPARTEDESSKNLVTPQSAVEGDRQSWSGEDVGKKRGRRRDQKRWDAIRSAMSTHGEDWRNHLGEIFQALDGNEVAMGDLYGREIDLGDGQTTNASKWDDLDLARGAERRRIIDALRKYIE